MVFAQRRGVFRHALKLTVTTMLLYTRDESVEFIDSSPVRRISIDISSVENAKPKPIEWRPIVGRICLHVGLLVTVALLQPITCHGVILRPMKICLMIALLLHEALRYILIGAMVFQHFESTAHTEAISRWRDQRVDCLVNEVQLRGLRFWTGARAHEDVSHNFTVNRRNECLR